MIQKNDEKGYILSSIYSTVCSLAQKVFFGLQRDIGSSISGPEKSEYLPTAHRFFIVK